MNTHPTTFKMVVSSSEDSDIVQLQNRIAALREMLQQTNDALLAYKQVAEYYGNPWNPGGRPSERIENGEIVLRAKYVEPEDYPGHPWVWVSLENGRVIDPDLVLRYCKRVENDT